MIISKRAFIALLLFTVSVVHAQTKFEIGNHTENSMVISGTSTFHDWTMKSKTFTGNAQFILTTGNDIKSLKELEFLLPVTTLKSNKKALNKNAYKALKTEQFKNIQYKLTSATIVGEKDYRYQIATVGNLTIAGVTKDVNVDIYCMANKNGSMTCSGKYKIKMTDYKVEPPYFMGGLMTTGEFITLDFTMRFER